MTQHVPLPDAEELVADLRSAKLDVEAHFIGPANLDGQVFTGSGHALGNRTEIVLQVAGKYLKPDGSHPIRRNGLSDFDLREEMSYPTQNGRFVISYAAEYPSLDSSQRVLRHSTDSANTPPEMS